MTNSATSDPVRLAALTARDMLAAHLAETFGPDVSVWRETVFWGGYAALDAALAEPAGVTLPDYPGETFVALYTTAQHYEEGQGYASPTPERPANLYSVRARTTDGPAYVLTDHGTQDDADAAAKLIGSLTGLPVEPPEGTPFPDA